MAGNCGVEKKLPGSERMGIQVRLEPGSYIGQGHVDQWLAYLSQPMCRLIARSKSMGIGIRFLIGLAKPSGMYRRIGARVFVDFDRLTRCFPNELSWTAKDGKTWTIEPLVEFEAKQDLEDSPCGGMHRLLMGLAHAIEFRQRHDLPRSEAWEQAELKVQDSIDRISPIPESRWKLLNALHPAAGNIRRSFDHDQRYRHTFEFLAYALRSTHCARSG